VCDFTNPFNVAVLSAIFVAAEVPTSSGFPLKLKQLTIISDPVIKMIILINSSCYFRNFSLIVNTNIKRTTFIKNPSLVTA
jgi:hypothetical protein